MWGRPHIAAASPFTLVVLLTLITLFTTATAVILLAKRFGPIPRSDPFAIYMDIFPGSRADTSALEARGFSCVMDSLSGPADVAENCASSLRTGTISSIHLLTMDGVVKLLDFILRQGAFSIGDLAVLWGTTDIHETGGWVSLNWPEHHVSGASRSEDGQFSYFQSVTHLSFGLGVN